MRDREWTSSTKTKLKLEGLDRDQDGVGEAQKWAVMSTGDARTLLTLFLSHGTIFSQWLNDFSTTGKKTQWNKSIAIIDKLKEDRMITIKWVRQDELNLLQQEEFLRPEATENDQWNGNYTAPQQISAGKM